MHCGADIRVKSAIVDFWMQVRASYWFIPSLMAVAALLLSFAVVYVDERLGDSWLAQSRWLFDNRPAGARALLSTVAGSMITVAGVTFSMTLLAVSHASAQFGPRLLTGFMRDRGNQVTLGTFIATFLYCLMVLRTVHAGTEDPATAVDAFVPHVAIMIAVVLAILSVVVLIYYIHHIPQSISVANVVQRVGNDLVAGIAKLYPERIGSAADPADLQREVAEPLESNQSAVVRMPDQSGYLRIVDTTSLLESTVDNDIVVEVLQRPGEFAIPGQPVLRLWPADRLDDDLERDLIRLFSWGAERNYEQDVLYPVEQLLEILGKAMSPGVNSQYTAILCLDQFERAISEILQRKIPSPSRFDNNDNLRVVARPIEHGEFLDEVFSPLRQFLRGDWITTRKVLQVIDSLAAMPELVGSAALLEKHRRLICEEIEEGEMCKTEKRMLL